MIKLFQSLFFFLIFGKTDGINKVFYNLQYYQMTLYTYRTLPWWLECLPMARETGIQSQVESYQRLKKWYLMPPCLTLSIIRYKLMVKWSNPGKGVAAPSPTSCCSSYWKGSLQVALSQSRQFYLLIYIYIYIFTPPSQMMYRFLFIYIYIYIYLHPHHKWCTDFYLYIYIYIYLHPHHKWCTDFYLYIYIYIYIYIYKLITM